MTHKKHCQMKSTTYNSLLRLLTPVVVLMVLAGCKKTKDETLNLPRQFMPGTIKVTAGETQAKLDWGASQFASAGMTYTVEVSTDTLFQTAAPISKQAETPTLTLTEAELEIETKYYARVKANAVGSTSESYWVHSNGFRITGEQIFSSVLDAELKDKSVILRWRPYAGLTRIMLTPAAGGSSREITLTADDVTDAMKLIEGLTAQTSYVATIYQNNVRKGVITFTTKEPSIYSIVLTPADDLVAAVAAAADGDLIGLQPGTYNCVDGTGAYVNLVVEGKTVGIASVSDNPADTKVNYREVTLKGTGAGVRLRGIGFDGLAAGSASAYFINLVGLGADADAATFKNVIVDNCVVSNMGNCFFRGNRAANNAHKIDTIRIANSIISDSRYLSAYTFFTMEKLEFKSLEMINSTFNRLGRAIVGYSTNITVPVIPRIVIDQCTINSFGRDARNNFFVDANGNQLTLTIENSIIANTPMSGQTTGTSLIRGSATTASMRNCNYFNLTDGAATPTNLTFPALVTQQNNTTANLGWTESQNTFTLPAGSDLRTASSSGGAIGDPRWAL